MFGTQASPAAPHLRAGDLSTSRGYTMYIPSTYMPIPSSIPSIPSVATASGLRDTDLGRGLGESAGRLDPYSSGARS